MIIEHPDIACIERTGHGPGQAPQYLTCPECGWETDTYYKDDCGYVVGCDECIRAVDVSEEIEERERL